MTDEPDAGWILDAVAEGRDPLSEWAERTVTEPIVVTVCAACVREGAGYIELVHEAHEDGSSVCRCPNCLTVGIVHLNMGMLDLGIRRDELIEDRNDYALFGEVFARPPAVGIVRDGVVTGRYDWAAYGERRGRLRRLRSWLRRRFR